MNALKDNILKCAFTLSILFSSAVSNFTDDFSLVVAEKKQSINSKQFSKQTEEISVYSSAFRTAFYSFSSLKVEMEMEEIRK